MYPFDYCIIVINEVKPFVKLQFETLIVGIANAFELFPSFHIVDKSTKDGVIDYCKKRIPAIYIHELEYYSPQTRTGEPLGSDWQWDFAFSYQYAIEKCGSSEWILINHPDIVYWDAKPFLDGLAGMIRPDVGVIWNVGTMLIRRKAYEQCHLGLWPLFDLTCFLDKGREDLGYLLNTHDERRKDYRNGASIVGLEANELFFAEMQLLGWNSLVIPHNISQHTEHTSGSTKHDFNMSSLSDNRVWTEKINLVNARLKALGE